MPEEVHPDYFDGRGKNPMQGTSIHHGRRGPQDSRGNMQERMKAIAREVEICRARIEADRKRREQRR